MKPACTLPDAVNNLGSSCVAAKHQQRLYGRSFYRSRFHLHLLNPTRAGEKEDIKEKLPTNFFECR